MDGANKLQTVFQTLGDVNRLRIIRFIGNEERSVSEIVQTVSLSQPLVSHHLKVLRENQILETERKGPFVYYRLKNHKLLEALQLFDEIFGDLDLQGENKMPFFCSPPWEKNK
jgi:ArsR family transcriptional regulator